MQGLGIYDYKRAGGQKGRFPGDIIKDLALIYRTDTESPVHVGFEGRRTFPGTAHFDKREQPVFKKTFISHIPDNKAPGAIRRANKKTRGRQAGIRP